MSPHLEGICKDCIMGKMDEELFNIRNEHDSQIFGMLHADLMGPMNPEARWTHAKFSLIINDDCSAFGFVFNLKHRDKTQRQNSQDNHGVGQGYRDEIPEEGTYCQWVFQLG